MRGVIRDAAYALRLFRRAPAFTAIIIFTLALGIGANTAVFSILHAVLLEPLPYRDSGRLIVVWDHEIHNPGTSKLFDQYSDYENWKQNSRTLEQVAAVSWAPQASPDRLFTGRGPARGVMALPVTPEFFSLLGVEPMIGRVFGPRDAAAGCVVVLTESFWRSALGADRNIAGQSIRLDGKACTVLGVMPAAFAFLPPEAPVAMWTIMPRPADPAQMAVGVFGRLRPGVTTAAAQAEILARHRQLHAHDRWGTLVDPVVYDLHAEFTWLTGRNLRLSLLVLFAAVSFVLLICCVNVANLLLGRAAGRQREMALRAALGSGRARLLRQLLTESLLLAAAASVAGVLLAAAAVHYFRVARPIEMPPGTALEVNAAVLAFTALLSIVTAVAFGLVPAWKASRTDLNESLKAGKGSSADRGRRRWGNALIVAEVMLTVILLAGAGLLIRTLQRFSSAPLGFDPDGLMTASLGLPKTGYSEAAKRSRFYDRMLDALDGIPGIQFAALSSALPIVGGGSMDSVAVEGRPEPPADAPLDSFGQTVSADYFRAMRTPLEKGRFFELQDGERTEPVVIINEALARKYFPREDPVGQRIRPQGSRKVDNSWLRVIGVVGNEKRTIVYREMAWVEEPMMYRPVTQNPLASLHLIVRLRGGTGTVGAEIQRAVAVLDPEVPVGEIQPARQLERRALSFPRFRAVLLGAFAAMALLLAVVGVFGVLSHAVVERTHEIGVRMALGAQRSAVVNLILKQGLMLTALGVVLGSLAAWQLGRYLESLLYGVRSVEPLLLAGASVVLMAASLAAMYIPARRASRIDPMTALKYE